jgi:hypothetical protein
MMINDNLMGYISKRIERKIKDIEGEQEKKKAEVCSKAWDGTLLLIVVIDHTKPEAATNFSRLNRALQPHVVVACA